jgi:dihydroxyacid dehydratase/phosphogluconate dehydratase
VSSGGPAGLRSGAWLGGDDEVALNHRAALRAAGWRRDRAGRSGRSGRSSGRPLIGIACTASDLNRCDRGLTALAAAVRRGVQAAGGLPLEFPVMSLSEDLMKPTAMLYRNLLAIEVEETIRPQPLDGLVALGNCDKTVPAYLMALGSADIPGLIVTGGYRVPASFQGSPLGSGTALWRLYDARRSGAMDDGAGRRGLTLPLEQFAQVSARVPVIADIAPIGTGLMPDLARAGGVPAVLAAIRGQLDLSALTATGAPLGESLADGDPLWPIGAPVTELPAFMVVRGNLAPSGAVIKTAAASPSLLHHRGPAIVFHSYAEMRARISDPALDVTADSVLVLAGCGPAGMAMPEWGNIPIPAKLLGQGVTDMLRITDGRMSGTGFGTVVLHVAPESAVGGPLSRLRDGDLVSLDAYAGELSASADLDAREPVLPAVADKRGWPVLHRMHVTQAPEGCDYDFLQAKTPEQLPFAEPIIGRS